MFNTQPIASAAQLQSHRTEHDTLLKPFDFHLGNKSEQWLLVVGKDTIIKLPADNNAQNKGPLCCSASPFRPPQTLSRRGGRDRRWASCTTVCRVSYRASRRRLKGFSDFPTTGLTKMTAGYILASRNRNNLPLLILWGAGATCSVFNTLQLSNHQRSKTQSVVQFYLLNLHFQQISLLSYAINDIRLADNKLYRPNNIVDARSWDIIFAHNARWVLEWRRRGRPTSIIS